MCTGRTGEVEGEPAFRPVAGIKSDAPGISGRACLQGLRARLTTTAPPGYQSAGSGRPSRGLSAMPSV